MCHHCSFSFHVAASFFSPVFNQFPGQVVAGNSLSSGTVCVQWIWADTGAHDGSNHLAVRADIDTEGDELGGLYPARTAFVLLGPPPAADDGEDGGGRSSGPSITVSRVLASRVDALRRRASQLKVNAYNR